jgi:hypothetical protein
MINELSLRTSLDKFRYIKLSQYETMCGLRPPKRVFNDKHW